MQPLACYFKKATISRLCTQLAWLWLVSCQSASSPGSDTGNNTTNTGSQRIELPHATAGKPNGDTWGKLPTDLRDGSGEVSLPLNGYVADQSNISERRRVHRAKRTDEEVAGQSRRNLNDRSGNAAGSIEQTLELEPVNTENQAPSFNITVQKIKDLYKKRKLEEALIETNELLRFYPDSAQLYTMKGTLHQRLSQTDLALKSFQRAYEIEPTRKLLSQIEYLEEQLKQRQKLRDGEGAKKW